MSSRSSTDISSTVDNLQIYHRHILDHLQRDHLQIYQLDHLQIHYLDHIDIRSISSRPSTYRSSRSYTRVAHIQIYITRYRLHRSFRSPTDKSSKSSRSYAAVIEKVAQDLYSTDDEEISSYLRAGSTAPTRRHDI